MTEDNMAYPFKDNVTHECSYYCNGNIHAIETAVNPKINLEDIRCYFDEEKENGLFDDKLTLKVINIKPAHEASPDFLDRAFGDEMPDESYIPYLVFVEIVEKQQ